MPYLGYLSLHVLCSEFGCHLQQIDHTWEHVQFILALLAVDVFGKLVLWTLYKICSGKTYPTMTLYLGYNNTLMELYCCTNATKCKLYLKIATVQ